jgi:hypothetical protein
LSKQNHPNSHYFNSSQHNLYGLGYDGSRLVPQPSLDLLAVNGIGLSNPCCSHICFSSRLSNNRRLQVQNQGCPNHHRIASAIPALTPSTGFWKLEPSQKNWAIHPQNPDKNTLSTPSNSFDLKFEMNCLDSGVQQ